MRKNKLLKCYHDLFVFYTSVKPFDVQFNNPQGYKGYYNYLSATKDKSYVFSGIELEVLQDALCAHKDDYIKGEEIKVFDGRYWYKRKADDECEYEYEYASFDINNAIDKYFLGKWYSNSPVIDTNACTVYLKDGDRNDIVSDMMTLEGLKQFIHTINYECSIYHPEVKQLPNEDKLSYLERLYSEVLAKFESTKTSPNKRDVKFPKIFIYLRYFAN